MTSAGVRMAQETSSATDDAVACRKGVGRYTERGLRRDFVDS
jgi:hypothetical protein